MSSETPPARSCPVGMGKEKAPEAPVTNGTPGVCPVAKKPVAANEPPDTSDHPLKAFACQKKVEQVENPVDEKDKVSAKMIPANGRGNSEDGQHWLNPSANQLYRALKRNNKPIEDADSLDVAFIHEMVTDRTWNAVMEFENLHTRECAAPTLARFEGKDGIYSLKARMLNLVGVNLPFDRHDWTVDRCGQEVRYIIDYYATGTEYAIDARPAGVSGLWDRLRLAGAKILRKESPW